MTTTTPPNSWRRLLGEIWADAEDHGLGTWNPTFVAAPGKQEQASAFVESRAALLTEKRLYPATTLPDLADVEDEELLAMYHAVQAAAAELLVPGASVRLEQIGLAAWNRLSIDQRRNSLGTLLGCYVHRIREEERERAHQEIADDPNIVTCLQPDDVTSAWDSALAGNDGQPVADYEAVVDRGVLQRLLEEVEMLRRRLDTTTEPAP